MSGAQGWCPGRWAVAAHPFRTKLSCEVQGVSACGACRCRSGAGWGASSGRRSPAWPAAGTAFGGGAGAGLLAALAGRLLCDTYLGARELLREVDYTLATLARIHLGQTRSDLRGRRARCAR